VVVNGRPQTGGVAKADRGKNLQARQKKFPQGGTTNPGARRLWKGKPKVQKKKKSWQKGAKGEGQTVGTGREKTNWLGSGA